MYCGIACPECARALKVSRAQLGQSLRCPHCNHSFVADAEAATDAASGALPVGDVAERGVRQRSKGTDVGLFVSGLIAGAVTFGFYKLALPPIADTYVGSLLGARGWVPYAVVFLTLWSVAILLRKFLKLRRHRRALLFDFLPDEFGAEIRPDDVPRFLEHVKSLPERATGSFLGQRVQRGLEHFRTRASAQSVRQLLGDQAEMDEQSVESSYAMLLVFIWAVPILGFIGTVLGIGDAVSSFSHSIVSTSGLENSPEVIAQIKESLSGVTTGLAVAFDTTLLALCVSILLMLPTHWLQKLEDDHLHSVTEYCGEELAPRLVDRKPRRDDSAGRIEVLLEESAQSQREAMDGWAREIREVGTELVSEMATGWRAAHEELRATQAEDDQARRAREQAHVEQLGAAFATAAQQQQQFLDAALARQAEQERSTAEASVAMSAEIRGIQTGAAEAAEAQLARISEVSAELVASLEAIGERTKATEAGVEGVGQALRESVHELVQALRDTSREHEGQMSSVAESLTNLGDGLRTDLPAAVEAQRAQLESTRAGFEELTTLQERMIKNLQTAASYRDLLLTLRAIGPRLEKLTKVLARVEETLDTPRRSPLRFFGSRNGSHS